MRNRYRVISICDSVCDVLFTTWPNIKTSWRFEHIGGGIRVVAVSGESIAPVDIELSRFDVGTIIETEYCLHRKEALF